MKKPSTTQKPPINLRHYYLREEEWGFEPHGFGNTHAVDYESFKVVLDLLIEARGVINQSNKLSLPEGNNASLAIKIDKVLSLIKPAK